MKQADIALILKPGTDGALACAVMHVLFRDGTPTAPISKATPTCPRELEAHLQTRTPEWAAAITGLSVDGDRGLRARRRHDQAHLLPPRLRLRALAQRRR